MNVKGRLSKRIHMNDILEIIYSVQGNEKRKQMLYELIYDPDEIVAYQTAWALNHLTLKENEWLYSKQDELIDEALICRHPGRRRLLLNLLYRQPFANPIRADFFNFCMESMISGDEPIATQAVCMKLAYELCLLVPELLGEFRSTLEIMEPDLLSPALRATRKNILAAMPKRKSLQLF